MSLNDLKEEKSKIESLSPDHNNKIDETSIQSPLHHIKFKSGTYGKITQNEDKTITKQVRKYRNNKYLESTSIKEVSFLSSYVHKNIIELNFIDVANNYIIINLEYGGIPLDEWCNTVDTEIRISNLPFIIFQILDILAFLESNLIVHGDIKPRNILINPKTLIIKLIDFGAVHFDCNVMRETKSYRSFSNCTYQFSSPEMLSFDDQTIKIKPELSHTHDIFSLGLVVKFIILNKYEDGDETLILNGLKSKIYSLHIDYGISLSEHLDDLITKMLTINSKKRPHASELLKSYLFSQYTSSPGEIKNNNSIKINNNTIIHRTKLVRWIFEVCDHLDMIQLSPLAVNIFDRFMSKSKTSLLRTAHVIACCSILLSDSLINSSQISIQTIIDLSENKFLLNEIESKINEILVQLDSKIYRRTFDCLIRERNIRIHYKIIELICDAHENMLKPPEELLEMYLQILNRRPSLEE